jgi:hypothetical protein
MYAQTTTTNTDTIKDPSINHTNILDATSFAGATADIKLNACLAQIASTGGTCDARGFGKTTQIIAATVKIIGAQGNGYSSPAPLYALFSQNTVFEPASASTQMFQIGQGSHVDGLNVYTGNVRNYAQPAILFKEDSPKVSWFYLGVYLTNSSVYGTTGNGSPTTPAPAAGSACFAFVSDNSARAISFAHLLNDTCVDEYDGILISASGNGYVNSNNFNAITIYNTVYGIEMVTTGPSGASITANNFTGLNYQWGNLGSSGGPSIYAIYLHGAGNVSPIRENTFWGTSLWDVPSNRIAIDIAGDGTATRNVFQGLLNLDGTFNQLVDGNTANVFWDLNFQSISPFLIVRSTNKASLTVQAPSTTTLSVTSTGGSAVEYLNDGGGTFSN